MPAPPPREAAYGAASPSGIAENAAPIQASSARWRSIGARNTKWKPVAMSARAVRWDVPPARPAAGRRLRPTWSSIADTANVAAFSTRASDGDSSATSTPPAAKPATWATWPLMLQMAAPTT